MWRPKSRNGTKSAPTKHSTTTQKRRWPGNKDGALARTTQTSHRRQVCIQNTTGAHEHRCNYNNHTATFATPHTPKDIQPCRPNLTGEEWEPHHSTNSKRDHKCHTGPLHRARTPDLDGGVTKSRPRALTANKGKIEKEKIRSKLFWKPKCRPPLLPILLTLSSHQTEPASRGYISAATNPKSWVHR